MDGTYFREICDEKGCRIFSTSYDVIKLRESDNNLQFIPVKLKNYYPEAEYFPEQIHVLMFSDYICPWCLLAAAVLDKLSQKYPVLLEHVGIELYPQTPVPGCSIKGIACTENAIRRINYMGEAYGLHLSDPEVRPNTHIALLVGEYAKKKSLHDSFVRAMWNAYLVKGKHIGELEVIIETAHEIGITKEEVLGAIQDVSLEEALAENAGKADRYQVTAVPTIIMNDTYLIRGMEDESVYEQVLNRL